MLHLKIDNCYHFRRKQKWKKSFVGQRPFIMDIPNLNQLPLTLTEIRGVYQDPVVPSIGSVFMVDKGHKETFRNNIKLPHKYVKIKICIKNEKM